MKHVVYLLGALLLLGTNLKADDLQKEFVIEKGAEDHRVLLAGKQGLVMIYNVDGEARKTRRWHFRLYDNQFEKKWTRRLVLDEDFSFVKGEISKDSVLHIFMSNSKNSEYYYITLDLISSEIDHFSGRIPIKAETSFFQLAGNHAVFGGNADYSSAQNSLATCLTCTCVGLFLYDPLRDHATLNYIDYKAKSSKPIIVNYKGQTTLNDITVNENDATFVAMVEVFESRYKSQLHLLNYDANGKEQSRIPLDPDKENVSLLDGFIYTTEEAQYVVGTYASKPTSIEAQGLYFTTLKNGSQMKIQRYELNDLEEFWKYLGKGFLVRRDQKDKSVENRNLRWVAGLNFRILPNKIEKRGDEILYVAEVYYPTYTTESEYSTSTGEWEERRVFDGYYFTHGIVASFDLDGKMLWIDSYPIHDKSPNLRSQAKMLPDEASNDFLLMIKSGDSIITQAIRKQSLEYMGKLTEILPSEKYEKFNSGYTSFDYWYDKNFVAYGRMSVKDKDARIGKRNEIIFYFRKIEYK